MFVVSIWNNILIYTTNLNFSKRYRQGYKDVI